MSRADQIAHINRASTKLSRLLFAMNDPLANWAFYLIHPDFDHSPELRNMIFCLLVTALAETASEADNRLGALRREAERTDDIVALTHLPLVQAYCDGIAHLLGDCADEEMIALQRWRNGLVHGRLGGAAQDRFSVYVVRGSKISTTKVDRETYLNGTIATTSRYGTPQNLMESVRTQVCGRVSFLWTLSMVLNMGGLKESLMREFNEHRVGSVRIKLTNDCFIDTHNQLVAEARDVDSLWGWRDHIVSKSPPPLLDPMIAALATTEHATA